MSSPSRWALNGIFLINHEEVMPWSICSWLFNCPKIETFASWAFLSHALRNHDQELIKWCLWLQNKMLTKIFDFWLSNDHFAPAVDCEAFRVFDCVKILWALKLDIWMLDNVYRHVGLDWTLENLNFFARTKTLILTVLGGNWTVQPLRDFESSGDWSWQILKNMGGQILGYNNAEDFLFYWWTVFSCG